MTQADPTQQRLIIGLLETHFNETPYPPFAGLYDRSWPIEHPEHIATAHGQYHDIRLAAEDFRTKRPFSEYDLYRFDEAFDYFSAQTLAYFIPKIFHFLISEDHKTQNHNFEDRFWAFLADERSNKSARLFDETTRLYSFEQREVLGLALLFLCFREDAQGDDFTRTWFYKNTLKFLFSSDLP
ncbi:MAG: hypothetical protein ACRBB0_01910 [Pelagimonas sp.]|uniref:hypothetical protein n=1 Tax=Pelagimonas sp. TaxID=2073170 RepID=UPI003D6C6CB7